MEPVGTKNCNRFVWYDPSKIRPISWKIAPPDCYRQAMGRVLRHQWLIKWLQKSASLNLGLIPQLVCFTILGSPLPAIGTMVPHKARILTHTRTVARFTKLMLAGSLKPTAKWANHHSINTIMYSIRHCVNASIFFKGMHLGGVFFHLFMLRKDI